ncbi:hypothetical protein ACO0QE_003710 [Hanseniaspora vineae]
MSAEDQKMGTQEIGTAHNPTNNTNTAAEQNDKLEKVTNSLEAPNDTQNTEEFLEAETHDISLDEAGEPLAKPPKLANHDENSSQKQLSTVSASINEIGEEPSSKDPEFTEPTLEKTTVVNDADESLQAFMADSPAVSSHDTSIVNDKREENQDQEFVAQLKQLKLAKPVETSQLSNVDDTTSRDADIETLSTDQDRTLDEDSVIVNSSMIDDSAAPKSAVSPPVLPPRDVIAGAKVPPSLPPRENNFKTTSESSNLLPPLQFSRQRTRNASPASSRTSAHEHQLSPQQNVKFKKSMLQIHAVPPPLSEEYKSPRFLRNLKINEALSSQELNARHGTSLTDHVEQFRINSAATSSDYDMIVDRLNENSKSDVTNQESVLESTIALKSTFKGIKDRLTSRSRRRRRSQQELHETETQSTNGFNDVVEDEHSIISYAEDEAKEIAIDWPFWTSVVYDYEKVAQQEPEKMEQEISKGIPSQIRGVIWQLISRSKSKALELLYEKSSNQECIHENVIKRDLKRTNFIPHNRLDNLFNVLKAYANYDTDVGYTQGMGFITTPLLLQTDCESDAFGLLVRLMESYKVREMFLPDMPGLMLKLYQFDRILEESSPGLYNHLARQGVRSTMYATQWFLTFFGYKFPLEFVLRIFDIVFAEGAEALLKFAIALMLKNESNLLALKFDQLLEYLKSDLFNSYLHKSLENGGKDLGSSSYSKKSRSALSLFRTNSEVSSSGLSNQEDKKAEEETAAESCLEKYNVDEFIRDAMKIKIMPISLKRYEKEYAEIHEIEKQKEQQFESLRIQNKNLEKELEKLKHDFNSLKHDHEAIANELINKRLYIETVSDEKRDLEEQLAQERHKNSLPNPDAELPSDLQHDLKVTMERNLEVMSKNEDLEMEVNRLNKVIEQLNEEKQKAWGVENSHSESTEMRA